MSTSSACLDDNLDQLGAKDLRSVSHGLYFSGYESRAPASYKVDNRLPMSHGRPRVGGTCDFSTLMSMISSQAAVIMWAHDVWGRWTRWWHRGACSAVIVPYFGRLLCGFSRPIMRRLLVPSPICNSLPTRPTANALTAVSCCPRNAN